MWRTNTQIVPKPGLALEADEASAGLAMACAYSTSDEYEAELIKSRREAGAYRSRSQRLQAPAAIATASPSDAAPT